MSLDVLREAIRLAERGERVGLATIVATRGSTPQKVGARLLARDGQRLAGTLGGGAVEASRCARQPWRPPEVCPRSVLSTGVDDWGLACGGTMLVLVEPLDGRALGWLRSAIEATEGREPVAIVTVDGEAAGTRLVVSAGGVAGDAWDAGLVAGNGAGPARWLGKRPRRPAPPVPSSTPSPSRPRPRWSSSEPGTWGRRSRASPGLSACR